MIAAIALAIASVIVAVIVHYECLSVLSRVSQSAIRKPRTMMLVVIFGVFVAHMFEIATFAAAYWMGDTVGGIGHFAGGGVKDSIEYFYFSAECFTSLGLGDMYPLGNLRLLAGVEVLNGQLLIAWSASFTYLIMEQVWIVGGSTTKVRKP